MVNARPKQFASDGYCLFPDVLKRDEAVVVRGMLDEALEEPLPLPSQWHREYDDSTDGIDRANVIGEPHTRALPWLELCRHPRILDAVEAVLGPNLILVYSSVFSKSPRESQAVAWHQDNNYWPSVHGTDVVTVWLAVDDADAGNCAMEVIPGSHREHRDFDTVPSGENQTLSKKVELAPDIEASAVTLAMNAGSLSIHDSYILHGSGVNTSGRRRAGYTIRYCSTDTAWVDVATHPIPVYLVRGSAGERGQDYVDLRPDVVATPELLIW